MSGVYSSIGTPGSDDTYGGTKDSEQDLLDRTLNRTFGGLSLPASIVRTVVSTMTYITLLYFTRRRGFQHTIIEMYGLDVTKLVSVCTLKGILSQIQKVTPSGRSNHLAGKFRDSAIHQIQPRQRFDVQDLFQQFHTLHTISVQLETLNRVFSSVQRRCYL